MAYITLDELKTALGVGDLYPDDQLNNIISVATNVLKPLLDDSTVGISNTYVDSGKIFFYTIRRHSFNVGDSVAVSGTNYNATYTVTDRTGFTFTAATTSTESARTRFYKPMATATSSTNYTYSDVPEVRSAALMIAMDVFNAQTVPGGQAQGVDFQPGPYMMGRSLATRVSGLISRLRDPNGMIG